MKLHGICVVKNEADILEYHLDKSLLHFDYIYLFDNGSDDQTWEIINQRAAIDSRVVPFVSDGKPFRDSLRGEVFRAFQNRARDGDWWCRLDADEFYVDNPRTFLSVIPIHYHVVWSVHFNYYLTQSDLLRIPSVNLDKPPTFDGKFVPRFYKANASEARFFRHRTGLIWPEGASWPLHMGLVWRRRIRLKHWQYRSPQQIEVRLRTRRAAELRGYKNFKHAVQEEWHDKIFSETDLTEDVGNDGLFFLDENLPRHLESTHHRLIKRVMHGFGIWP